MSDIKPSEIMIYSIRTTIDGGARVTFDFSSEDSWLVKKLLDKKMSGDELVKCLFIDEKTQGIRYE